MSAPFAAELSEGERRRQRRVPDSHGLGAASFAAELSPATLRATSLGGLKSGRRVNSSAPSRRRAARRSLHWGMSIRRLRF